jgi:ribosomal protein RSM22 (predicted rRNA methylase)
MFLKCRTNHSGYLIINLSKDGVRITYSVHRLIALAFIARYFEGAEVNHIDYDRSNNNLNNLEWVTPQKNSEHSNAECWLITHPCKKVEKVFNLAKFCRQYGLQRSNMVTVSKGRQHYSKGFKCEKLVGE